MDPTLNVLPGVSGCPPNTLTMRTLTFFFLEPPSLRTSLFSFFHMEILLHPFDEIDIPLPLSPLYAITIAPFPTPFVLISRRPARLLHLTIHEYSSPSPFFTTCWSSPCPRPHIPFPARLFAFFFSLTATYPRIPHPPSLVWPSIKSIVFYTLPIAPITGDPYVGPIGEDFFPRLSTIEAYPLPLPSYA